MGANRAVLCHARCVCHGHHAFRLPQQRRRDYPRLNGGEGNAKGEGTVKWLLLAIILCMGVMSQNVVPIHIAFIPMIIPPLLLVFNRLKLDRRLVACVITFGLVTTYMFLPGFRRHLLERTSCWAHPLGRHGHRRHQCDARNGDSGFGHGVRLAAGLLALPQAAHLSKQRRYGRQP